MTDQDDSYEPYRERQRFGGCLSVFLVAAILIAGWLAASPVHALVVAGHSCPVPRAAYQLSGMTPREFMLDAADQRAMERFGNCVCGPDGTVDFDPRPSRFGYYAHPSCNRNGWNGKRYRGKS